MVNALNVLKKYIDSMLKFFLIFIFIMLVVCVIWQVISRWMGISSLFTDETARYMFIWVGLFGAAYAHGLKRHLAIDVLLEALKGVPKMTLQTILHVLVMTFAGGVMIYGGGTLLLNTLANGQITPTLQIPMWIVYLSLPLSGCFIFFYSLFDCIMLFCQQTNVMNQDDDSSQTTIDRAIQQGDI